MIKIDTKMPNSCADCFACGINNLTCTYKCRLTGEELPHIKFYDLLATQNPKMKNCPLQEDTSTLKSCSSYNSTVDKSMKHGEWIQIKVTNPMFLYGYCSLCGFEQSLSNKLNYCPNCGAKMEKNKND